MPVASGRKVHYRASHRPLVQVLPLGLSLGLHPGALPRASARGFYSRTNHVRFADASMARYTSHDITKVAGAENDCKDPGMFINTKPTIAPANQAVRPPGLNA